MLKTKIMFTSLVVWCMVNLLFLGCSQGGSQPDSQSESQPVSMEKAPKAAAQIVINAPADNTELEGVEHLVRGNVIDYSRGNVFVLVHPLKTNLIWVQRPPSSINRDGSWQNFCCLGTETQGTGEYFELIAIITNNNLKEGQVLEKIPPDAIKSTVITVKRIR